ncbi:MAG: tetratricopeptide repeat protein [Segetibacter sp.]|nr:tetratricopeptide repeat protein [Segetibacter sp.]
MKKQQLLLVGSGFLLLVSLFFFGKTVPEKKPETVAANTPHEEKKINSEQLIRHAKERLDPRQVQKVTSIENIVIRGDIKNQQLSAFRQLASFWGDSIRLFEPYAYYTAEAAKLENSEKSLTFAAHLFLTNLKTESEHAMQDWLASNAKVLFEQALQINPANDSSRIGLGACYIFGHISDNPMEGIAPIRKIVEKDPNNLFGQFILGLGGIKSGQFDKAIERFLIVTSKDPNNLEAALNLAEAYDRKGDKANAIKWYTVVKDKVPNPDAKKELDARIKALK